MHNASKHENWGCMARSKSWQQQKRNRPKWLLTRNSLCAKKNDKKLRSDHVMALHSCSTWHFQNGLFWPFIHWKVWLSNFHNANGDGNHAAFLAPFPSENRGDAKALRCAHYTESGVPRDVLVRHNWIHRFVEWGQIHQLVIGTFLKRLTFGSIARAWSHETQNTTALNTSNLCFVTKNKDLHMVLDMHGLKTMFHGLFATHIVMRLSPKTIPFMVHVACHYSPNGLG